MIRAFAKFKPLDIELSRVVVVVDYLPNKVGVRDQLLEQIEVYYSGVKPEPKSIYICGYDCSYSIAWIEFSEREGADSPMSRFVRDFNYKRFLGNVLTVSVVERGHVVSGHVDNNEFVIKSRHFARSSTPERPPPRSRTDLLREVLPSAVPDGRTLGSKQIRHIARDENLCFTCLKHGHTRVECPTDPRFSTHLIAKSAKIGFRDFKYKCQTSPLLVIASTTTSGMTPRLEVKGPEHFRIQVASYP